MNVKIEKTGNKTQIVITADIDNDAPLSGSGKSKMLFTTGGNKPTDVKVQGETVQVGLNVYIKNKDFKPAPKE